MSYNLRVVRCLGRRAGLPLGEGCWLCRNETAAMTNDGGGVPRRSERKARPTLGFTHMRLACFLDSSTPALDSKQWISATKGARHGEVLPILAIDMARSADLMRRCALAVSTTSGTQDNARERVWYETRNRNLNTRTELMKQSVAIRFATRRIGCAQCLGRSALTRRTRTSEEAVRRAGNQARGRR